MKIHEISFIFKSKNLAEILNQVTSTFGARGEIVGIFYVVSEVKFMTLLTPHRRKRVKLREEEVV